MLITYDDEVWWLNMKIGGTYSLHSLGDSSSQDSKRPKQTPNSKSGAT